MYHDVEGMVVNVRVFKILSNDVTDHVSNLLKAISVVILVEEVSYVLTNHESKVIQYVVRVHEDGVTIDAWPLTKS